MNLRDLALDWATEILSQRWAPERFRLEVRQERLRLHRGLDRHVYAVELEVWEQAGTAELRMSKSGALEAARFPASPDGAIELCPLPAVAAEAALEAARAESSDLPLRIRSAKGTSGRRGGTLWVSFDHLPHDGRMTLELDPSDGERISFHCLPFQRGSRRSAALSKLTVVERARAQLDLPEKARLAYSKLSHRKLGRLWALRWEQTEGAERGWIKATLNGRSGQLCAWARVIKPAATLAAGSRVGLGEAKQALALAMQVRLGPAALLGEPVPGAVQRGDRQVPGWLAVVRTPRGVYRANLAGGRVTFIKQGSRSRSA